MANTRELRRRIRSVKNTSQITKAMQMVAATKMRRAQYQALSGRPYIFTLSSSLKNLIGKIHPEAHPLFLKNNSKKVGVILLTTDKALCGALNTNLFRSITQNLQPTTQFVFYTIGKKGRDFVIKTGKELVADFENLETVTFRQARQVGKLIIEAFLNKELGEVFILYPNFVTTLRQEPVLEKILPIDSEILAKELGAVQSVDEKIPGNSSEFLIEPDPDELLEYILVHSVETKIYQALMETKASEHSARMIAMQNATDNAKELVEDLTLSYNQTRQAAITNELLEITSAQAALE